MPRTRRAAPGDPNVSQAASTEQATTIPANEAGRRIQHPRGEIAELNRDLSDDQQEALAARWADAVRTRLAERVRRLRKRQDE